MSDNKITCPQCGAWFNIYPGDSCASCGWERPLVASEDTMAARDDWRLFIGWWCDGDIDEAFVDERTTWAEAYDMMVARFEQWTKDDCQSCAANAASQLPALRALQPGTEWQGEVEGDDYLITQNMVEAN